MNEKDKNYSGGKNNEKANKVEKNRKSKSESTEKKQKNKVSAQDFMLWLLTVLNEDACAEITGENEITVTDVLGSSFKLKVSVENNLKI